MEKITNALAVVICQLYPNEIGKLAGDAVAESLKGFEQDNTQTTSSLLATKLRAHVKKVTAYQQSVGDRILHELLDDIDWEDIALRVLDPE